MSVSPAARPSQSEAVSPSSRKRHSGLQRVQSLALQLADLILINIAFIAAYYARYELGLGGNVTDENYVDLFVYLPLQAGLTLTLFAVLHLAGLYRPVARRPLVEEAWNVVLTSSFGMTLFFAMVFLIRGFAYSRALFLMAWAMATIALVATRLGTRLVLALLRQRGIGIRRVLVVGGGPLSRAVMHVLTTEPGLHYRLVGFVHNDTPRDLGRFKCLGTLDDLAELVRSYQVDEVIVALASAHHETVSDIAQQCRNEGVVFKLVPDLVELSLSLSQVDVEALRGIPVIGMREVSIQGLNQFIKRALDVAVSGLAIWVLSPLWLCIALAVKLDSPGPVYFTQTRLGKNGKPFYARKFRSMHINAEDLLPDLLNKNEATGPIFKMRHDPRVTRVGRWLRRASLDELPQLWNVLRGDMSMVGPRPPLPSEVMQYEEWHKKRLTVAPGMTGLWQVSGRSELPFDEMVLLDIYYIENWSLGLDFEVVLRTLPAVLSGRGAY